MKNKWFVSLLMVVVMMCACWTGAVADEERKTFTSGDYEYALLDDGTVEITDYKGKAKELTIPDMLGGKKVTAIGNSAFAHCEFLTNVTIPDSVVSIDTNPFAFCSRLKTIFVSPEHPYFAVIDGVLFRKADKALISYPAGIDSPTYTIPQGIIAIENSAFYTCDSLTSITIPDSVTSIGDWAFYSCNSLTSITIPDSVMQIGLNPFVSCSALRSISVSPEQPYFAAIDGVLFRKADKILIAYPAGIKSSTYTIPQGITSIGDSAFSSCESLTSISIPDSVTSIGDGAFSSCESLTSISIPDSVTSIGDGVFSSCYSLTSISIPDSVTSLGDWAFNECEFLTNITIPDSVTSIGDGVFSGCESLTSISIPDSVTSIGDWAFSRCESLTSISIPDSVTSIGDWAFFHCDSLTSISIPDSVTSFGKDAFNNCPYITLTVSRNSYALEYAKTNSIPYTYFDVNNDWLNN